MDKNSKPETPDHDGRTLATLREKFEGEPLPEGGWPKGDWQLKKGERVIPPGEQRQPLTEERVREIVRDELSKVERCNEEQLKQLTEKAQEIVEKLLKEQLERQTARKRRESS